MKRYKIAALVFGLAVAVTACEIPERESGGDITPDRGCEFFCGDDWLDPAQN